MKPPPAPWAAAVLRQVEREIGGDAPPGVVRDLPALADASGGDARRLKRWLKRRLAGEPIAHIVGGFEFRGLRLAIDKRAYVTDPELTHLVDAVLARARELPAADGRAPLLAEIGVGCGSLALAIKQALPAAQIVGLDLDPDALAVAAGNAAAHRLPLRLVESDLFDDWPDDLPAPDLIYGDPPWGDANALYDGDRSAAHYNAMPPASAFPLGGRTGVHRQILRAVAQRGWSGEIWLNCGVLPVPEIVDLARDAAEWEILSPAPGLSLLRCRMNGIRAK